MRMSGTVGSLLQGVPTPGDVGLDEQPGFWCRRSSMPEKGHGGTAPVRGGAREARGRVRQPRPSVPGQQVCVGVGVLLDTPPVPCLTVPAEHGLGFESLVRTLSTKASQSSRSASASCRAGNPQARPKRACTPGSAAAKSCSAALIDRPADPRTTLTAIAHDLLTLLVNDVSVALNRAAMTSPELAELLLRHGQHTTGAAFLGGWPARASCASTNRGKRSSSSTVWWSATSRSGCCWATPHREGHPYPGADRRRPFSGPRRRLSISRVSERDHDGPSGWAPARA
ncbi:hypothetical protein QFZ82_007803 [Streptomyces sp. V4I23]|nr:hypothetical protein [Streptomyces sp. V4I23]